MFPIAFTAALKQWDTIRFSTEQFYKNIEISILRTYFTLLKSRLKLNMNPSI